jgi:hypothetical protein
MTIIFEVFNGIMAKATYESGICINVKLISHVSRADYYSFINWAGEIADNLITKHG